MSLTPQAAELYQRLGTALETAGDYGGAHEALTTAVGLCRTGDADALEHVCLSCVAYVAARARRLGRSVELCHELQAGDVASRRRLVADGVLGAIHAFRGEPARARPLLLRALDTASRLNVVSMQLDTRGRAGLVWRTRRAIATRRPSTAAFVLERWERSEDRPLRRLGPALGRGLLRGAGRRRRGPRVRRRAGARSRRTPAIPTRAPRSPMRWRRRRCSTGDAETAAEQLGRALELQATLDIPFERAQIQLRAGVVLAAAGERELALERLAERLPDRAPPGRPPAGHAGRRGDGAPRRVGRAPAGAPRGRRARRRRAVAPRARGHAPARGRAHQPRDRPRALPQPAHGRHAHAQHLRQARLPLARRRRRRARASSGCWCSRPSARARRRTAPEVLLARPLGAPPLVRDACALARERSVRRRAPSFAHVTPSPTTSAGPNDPSVSSMGMPPTCAKGRLITGRSPSCSRRPGGGPRGPARGRRVGHGGRRRSRGRSPCRPRARSSTRSSQERSPG